MDIKVIDSYFDSKIHKPFYMIVGDAEYKEILDNLRSRTTSAIRVSDCCKFDDKKPDLDTFREKLETADVSCDYNNIVVLGLGEYLALEGDKYARDFLSELVNFNLGSAQAVLILRGVANQAKALVKNDKRLFENGRLAFGDDLTTSVHFKFSTPGLGIYKITGIKNVLRTLEDGAVGEICANTIIPFQDSLLAVQRVKNSYEAISRSINMDAVPKECGSEEMWERFLTELRKSNFKTEKLFDEYGFSTFQDADLYALMSRDEYKSWLFYISLMMNRKELDGSYLGFVLSISRGIDSFKRNILKAIINVTHTDSRFAAFYGERKKLLSRFPESDIASFVADNRINVEESVYRLTDNTMVERQEVISWIANRGIPENLNEIYPALAAYMKKYTFRDRNIPSTFAAFLTNYFEEYKRQKLGNSISEEFLKKVDELALQRVYNRLPKRDELVKETYGDSTQLFWIDALGVEYLSYIVELARKFGLNISIMVGRAELPTITCENNGFFKNWPGDSRHPKEYELDETKHKEKGGYYYGPDNPYPVHLAKELEVIERVVSETATTLGLRKYDRVVIASDHGASRLAVLRKKEEKYDTDTQGQHSGRCCKFFPDCDLPFAIKEEEKGYIVLADYGRFKGSRAANVEVHGGASLEEVIVPVITLSLRDSSIKIKVVDEDKIKADYKTGIKITLYVNKTVRQVLTVGYGNKRYQVVPIDDNHYSVNIPDIKRAGTYPVDVYLGEGLAAHIDIKAAGKSASMNADFDDLF
jgi:hypothetical protein